MFALYIAWLINKSTLQFMNNTQIVKVHQLSPRLTYVGSTLVSCENVYILLT